MAADVVKLTSAKTVNGQSVRIAVDGGKVKVEARTSSRRILPEQRRHPCHLEYPAAEVGF